MNELRFYYLHAYGKVDCMDHYIKNCRIGYCCWKYWHTAKNHGLSMWVTVAWDIYREICEGRLRPEWKTTPVSFLDFRDKLSKQMILYRTEHRLYPNDDTARVAVRQNKEERSASLAAANHIKRISYQWKKRVSHLEKLNKGYTSTLGVSGDDFFHNVCTDNRKRLCFDVINLKDHVKGVVSHGSVKVAHACVVCGEACHNKCPLCDKFMHFCYNNRHPDRVPCFFHWHDPTFFGLAKDDCGSAKKPGIRPGCTRHQWQYPTQQEIDRHANEVAFMWLQDFQYPV